jgi:hypothetical protein
LLTPERKEHQLLLDDEPLFGGVEMKAAINAPMTARVQMTPDEWNRLDPSRPHTFKWITDIYPKGYYPDPYYSGSLAVSLRDLWEIMKYEFRKAAWPERFRHKRMTFFIGQLWVAGPIERSFLEPHLLEVPFTTPHLSRTLDPDGLEWTL